MNKDILINNFEDTIASNIGEEALVTIAVYNVLTPEYQGSYVARLFANGKPTVFVYVDLFLENIRDNIPANMVRFPRSYTDANTIIESWI